jgi:magnesium transporter
MPKRIPIRRVKKQQWPVDSAGRRMTTDVPTAKTNQTVGQVQKALMRSVDAHETINYIYVLDEVRKLIGVLSIKDLYRYKPSVKVSLVFKRDPIVSVHATAHQERVAYLALRHNIKAVPVVDQDHTFLGVIPSDAILSILYKETHEDLLRRAGVHYGHPLFDNVLTMTLWQSVRHRLPWLFVGLLGGILAAQVISGFEETIAENLILAAFIPLIVYMGGAVSAQMSMFVIRDLAVERRLPFLRYILRQLFIITVIGGGLSLLTYASTRVFYGQPHVSTVLAVSLFGAIVSSVFTGLIIPQVFCRMKMDPANASGPIATIIQDLLSIVIYFAVASSLL